jgi:hypothetical protein
VRPIFVLSKSVDCPVLAVVVVRETEKDLRSAQNTAIKELEPLVVTFHLPSMKIFFTNVITELVKSQAVLLT